MSMYSKKKKKKFISIAQLSKNDYIYIEKLTFVTKNIQVIIFIYMKGYTNGNMDIIYKYIFDASQYLALAR